MKKKILLLILSVVCLTALLYGMLTVQATEPETATIRVESATARVGTTVSVNVSISNNPGIATMGLDVSFDEGLTLISAKKGEALADLMFTPPSQLKNGGRTTEPCRFAWAGSDNAEEDGVLLTLTFEVDDSITSERTCNISVVCDGAYNENRNLVNIEPATGAIDVITYIPGDVDGNGIINMLDVLMLCQYYVDGCKYDPDGYAVTINENAGDVDANGVLNMLDVLLICQYYVDGCKYDPNGYAVELLPGKMNRKYEITWVLWDGNSVTTLVQRGELPVYPNGTPERPSDDTYCYMFLEWAPSIVPATGDATYTAVWMCESISLMDQFEAELVKWEPDRDESGTFIEGTGKLGFPSVVGDQLASLKELHNTIIEDDNLTLTSAQENRYEALLNAQYRLRGAEGYDDDIYTLQEAFELGANDTVYFREETKQNLDTIKEAYDEQIAPLFEDGEEIIYYAVGMENLPGYINYLNKLARYEALKCAEFEFKREYPNLTHFADFRTVDPTLADYDSIERIDGVLLDEWKVKWALDSDEELENCFLIIDSIDQDYGNRLGGYARILEIRSIVQTLKNHWVAATDVLFDDEDPRSIAAFKAGIVRVYLLDGSGIPTDTRDPRAIFYEDEDIVAYAAKADLLANKLLRAISLDDIAATFALRDAEFAKLVKIVDKFEAELVKWEPDRDESGTFIEGSGKLGFPGVEGDQLARLKDLHNLIIARNLPITEAQEERYQALLVAQARLMAIEAEDDRIYARQVSFGLGKDDVVLYKDETIKYLDGPIYLSKTITLNYGESNPNYVFDYYVDWQVEEPDEIHELARDLYILDEYGSIIVEGNTGKILVRSILEDYEAKVAPCFEEIEETIYYAVGMEDLPGHKNYVAKWERYWELDEARIVFETKYRADELTYFMDYNLYSPLLSSYDGIERTDGAWLDAWKNRYHLEDIRVERIDTIGYDEDGAPIIETVTKDYELENCFLIIDLVDQRNGVRLGGYKRVLAIRYFVQTLYDLNATYVEPNVYKDPHEDITTKNLVGQIKTEVDLGEKNVLWEHLPTLKDILNKQDIIHDTIYNLKFDLDSNLYPFWTDGAISYGSAAQKELCENRMLGLGREIRRDGRVYTVAEILDAIRYRVVVLEDTMQDLIDLGEYLLDTYYVDGEWAVRISDIHYIEVELPEIVEGFFISRGIAKDVADQTTNTANYNVMTRFFKISIYPYLEAAIRGYTNLLKQHYENVKPYIYDETGAVKQSYLPDLNKLIVAQSELFKMVAGVSVDDIDFYLEEYGYNGYPIRFSDFFELLITKVVTLVRLAEEADEAAVEINEKIELLEGTFNLGETAAVDEVTEQLIDWSEKYLGVLFEALADEDASWEENCKSYIAEIAQYFENTEVVKRTIILQFYIVEDGVIIADPERCYEPDIEEVVNDGILNIHKYNDFNSTTDVYEFITGENFNALKAIQAARVARYKSATAAWADLDMTPTANRYDIDASFEAFTNYVKEYYTNIETLEDEWAAIAEYYHIRKATKNEIEGPYVFDGDKLKPTYGNGTYLEGLQTVGEWTVCYPKYRHKYNEAGWDSGVLTHSASGVQVPIETKSADAVYAEVIQEKLDYENQWANGYSDTAVSMALREKAERFASYITGAEFFCNNRAFVLDVVEDYEGEFGELVAYEALCDRSAQYDSIMFLAELLDKTAVPTASEEGQYILEEVLEELDYYTAVELDFILSELVIQDVEELEMVVRELKTRIDDFREEFDYYGSIYNHAIVGANRESLDAELAAYAGAAKVYIINAFEKDQVGGYLYVRDEVTQNGHTYDLPGDEATLLTSYCVEMIQKVCENLDQVNTMLEIFRQQALQDDSWSFEFNLYPEFDFDSYNHFLASNS